MQTSYGTPYHKTQHRLKAYMDKRIPGRNKTPKGIENKHLTWFRRALNYRLLQECSGVGYYVFSTVLPLKVCDVRLPNAAGHRQALIQVDCINLISFVEMFVDSNGFVLHSFLLWKNMSNLPQCQIYPMLINSILYWAMKDIRLPGLDIPWSPFKN